MSLDAVWAGAIPFPGCEYLTPGTPPSISCEGIEAIATPIALATGEDWTGEEAVEYDYYRTRYTIWNQDDVAHDVEGVAQLNDDYIWYFTNMDAYETFDFSTDEDNSGATANMAFTNTAAVSTTLLSACIYEIDPDEGPDICLNPSPNLNLEAYYSTNGTLANGVATLTGVEEISTTLELEAGDYTMSVWARGESWASIGIGNGLEFVSDYVPGGVGWSDLRFDFTLDSATTITPSVVAQFAQHNVEITYICIADSDAMPPAPDTPTGCMNPDPTFNLPDLWYPSGNAEIAGGILSLPGEYDSVTTTVVLEEVGLYHFSFSALAEPVVSTIGTGLHLTFEDGGKWVTVAQDGTWRDYSWDQEITGTVTGTVTITAQYQNPGGVYLSYFCISYLGGIDPPPDPFGPDGPDLSVCMNLDPGIDDASEWIGTATITNSVAALSAGESLAMGIDIADHFTDYYIHVVGRSTSGNANSTFSWRGAEQAVTFPSTWFTQTLLFPRGGGIYPVLEIIADAGNAGDLEIDIICITAKGWTPPPDVGELDIWHPVCLDNYNVQTDYSDSFQALLIGTGRAGMPVHAVTAGVVVSIGVELSFNSTVYSDCIVIDHSHFYEVDIRSATCGIAADVAVNMPVERGALIGYTGEFMISDGQVLAALQVTQGWDPEMQWVNPAAYYLGYPDCFPYVVTIPLITGCDGDNGNGTFIAARYNPSLPSVWNPQDWVPYLGKLLYDRVAYPIMCALAPVINFILGAIETAINAIISAISPLLAFIYRIGKFFGYLLNRLGDLAGAVLAALGAGGELFSCGRETIGYFLDALRYATQAHSDLETLDPSSTITIGMGVALTLVSSTVANTFLVPMVLLIMGFAAWKLIPWGIREFRVAVGAGGD